MLRGRLCALLTVHVPGPPGAVTVTPTSPTSLVVRWHAPSRAAGRVTRYVVHYGEVGASAAASARQRTAEVAAGATLHTLTALSPHRRHSVRVVAWNANGAGESSDDVTALTYSDGEWGGWRWGVGGGGVRGVEGSKGSGK